MFEILTPVRLTDLAIAWMLAEALIMGLRYGSRGESAAAFWSAANSLAGLMLLLALRTAVVGAGTHWLALCLAGALLAHLCEWVMRRRLLARPEIDSA